MTEEVVGRGVVEIEAELDNTSIRNAAQEISSQLRDGDYDRAGAAAGDDFADGLFNSLEDVDLASAVRVGQFGDAGRDAGRDFGDGINAGLGDTEITPPTPDEPITFETDADFADLAAQARAAARAARQRVEIEATLDTQGIRRGLDGLFRDTQGDVVEMDRLLGSLTGSFANVARSVVQTSSSASRFGTALTTIGGQAAAAGSSMALVAAGALAAAPAVIGLGGAVVALASSVAQASGSLLLLGGPVGALGLAFGVIQIGSQGVTDAFEAQAAAQEELARTGEISETTMENLDAAMSGLAPSAREFVTEVTGLRDEWGSFVRDLQQPLFRGLGEDISNVAGSLLPQLSGALAPVARDINRAARSFLDWAGSETTIQRITDTIDGLRPILSNLMDAAGSVGDGLFTLFTDSLPQAGELSESIADIADRFQGWAEDITESGEFSDFLDRASDSAGLFLDVLGNIGSIIGSVFSGGADSGDNLLASIEQITQGWADFLNTDEGQQAILDFFQDVEDFIVELGPLMEDLSTAIGGLADLVGPLSALMGILSTISDIFPNLYELIGALGGLASGDFNLDGLIDSLGLLGAPIEGVRLAFQNLPGLIGGALSGLGGVVSGAFSSVFGFFASLPGRIGGLLSGLGGVISGAFSTVFGFFASLPGRIIGFLAPLPGLLINTAIQMMTGFFTALVTGFQTVATFFITLPARILGFTAGLGVVLVTVGIRLINGLRTGIVNGWNGVMGFFRSLPGRISNAFSRFGNLLLGAGRALINGLRTGAVTAWNNVVAFFTSLPRRILGFVTRFPTLLLNAGRALLNGMRTGVLNGWNTLSGWLGGLAGRAVSAVGNLGSTLLSAGGDLLRGLREGAVNAWEGVRSWFADLPSNIKSAIGDVSNFFSSIGSDIIDGIISGVSGAAGRLGDAVAGAAQDAFNSAKSVLGIDSPSKLFRDEVGAQIMAGWIEGIERNARGAERAIRDAAGRLAPAAQITMPTTTNVPRRGAPVPAYAGAGGVATQQQAAGVQVTQNFYGPTTSGGRLKEIDWTIRFASKARAETVAGVAR